MELPGKNDERVLSMSPPSLHGALKGWCLHRATNGWIGDNGYASMMLPIASFGSCELQPLRGGWDLRTTLLA